MRREGFVPLTEADIIQPLLLVICAREGKPTQMAEPLQIPLGLLAWGLSCLPGAPVAALTSA